MRIVPEKVGARDLDFQEEGDTTPIEILLEKNTLPQEGYRGEYIKEIAKQIYSDVSKKNTIDEMLASKKYKELSEQFALWAVEKNLESQKEDLTSFGVNFDTFYSEKSLHESNSVLSVLDNLKKANDIKEEDGKQVFTSMKYGDDKDRVVLRDDGRPTYLLADIAYHKTKMDRGFHQYHRFHHDCSQSKNEPVHGLFVISFLDNLVPF